MTSYEIFKTLINVLKSETIRTDMEFSTKNAQEAINSGLKNTGLTVLGIGMYSVVVEHEEHPGRVFKVSTSRWDGYRAYAKYCIEHAGEPLIPTVHSAMEQGNFAWYELEKYYPCAKWAQHGFGYCEFPTPKIGDIVNIIQHASYSIDMIDYQLKNNMNTRGMRKPKRDKYLNEMREYVMIAKAIYDTFKDTHRLDVHRGNIMLTVDQKVIITDPLANDLRREIPITEADPDFEVMV